MTYQQKSSNVIETGQSNTNSVFVTNLPPDYNEKELADIFKEFGMKVQKSKLLYDDSGKSKCAGFVEFLSAQEAQDAIRNAHNLNMDGNKRLNV